MAGKDKAEALFRSAEQALGSGRLDDAASLYTEALRLAPERADAWFNLGWIERARRRFEPALAAYGRALDTGIDRPEEVRVNRAAILSDQLFRPIDAEAELRTALEGRPGFVPALLGLGNLAEDAGRFEEAQEAYQALLQVEPGNGRARARLAMLELQGGHPDAVAGQLKGQLDLAATVEDRTELLFAIAAALDAAADYGEAFQALEAANLLALSLSPQRYDPHALERLVDSIIAAFPARPPDPAADEVSPVFIVGMFRSGSTLAEQMLARHPALTSAGELDAIPAIAAGLQPYPQASAGLLPRQVEQLRAQYAAESGTFGRIIDKRCDNVLHLGLIKSLFPSARIIHTVRKPLDNLLSIAFLRFGEGVSYGHRFQDSAHYLVQYRRLMEHWRALFGDDLHDLSYDALVTEPETTLRAALTFLDLPFDQACVTPERNGGPVRTASALQVRQPLHQRSSGRWQHYAAQLEPVRAYLERNGIAVG
ncbi:sulfotransferase [Sphingomonas sp. BN140010]|uniref:Sulfotransferase n=1 Tax=Sphingomonas arvum TaxID=2992113 RepID=A0ABT3JFV4_9SPHN|nr:tetratricopeptide repeat-containing sulfotransferase family protein [Sphingomonas sp. BN140010]MCW3797962.1 sulfotransferase [Sphingomonas sp. BN140010]